MDALVTCLDNNALKLDDGRSDAKTVAVALRPACYHQYAHSRDVGAEGLNPEDIRGFHAQDDAVFLQLATNTVLDLRARRH
jgi:hypothetical protein